MNRERVPARGLRPLAEPDWLARRAVLQTEVGTLPVLHDVDLPVFLALHLVHHHGGIGARWILDLHRTLLRSPALAATLECGPAGPAGLTALHVLRLLQPAPNPDRRDTPPLLDRIVARAACFGDDVPGLRFLLTLRELALRDRIAFLRQTLLAPAPVRDAVAVPKNRPPLSLHVGRIARTAFSLTRLAWQAVHSRP